MKNCDVMHPFSRLIALMLCLALTACGAVQSTQAPPQDIVQVTEPHTATRMPTATLTDQPTGYPCPAAVIRAIEWSPDGRKLAYAMGPYEAMDVFIVDLTTRSQTHLVDFVYGGTLYWSPDGSRIVVTGGDKVRLINIDGTNLRDILPADYYGLSWSPDGMKLAYIESNGTSLQLSILELSSGTSMPIYVASLSEMVLRHPLWSPDGKKIAFGLDDADETTPAELMVINSDGTQLNHLFQGFSKYYVYKSWSPNSQHIAFSSPDGQYSGAFVVNADGTGLTELTDYPAYTTAWLPDETGVVVLIETQPPPSLEFHLSQIALDGTLSILSEHKGHSATFSPDATRVAYISQEEGYEDLYVMNIDGTNKIRLTENPGYSTCFD